MTKKRGRKSNPIIIEIAEDPTQHNHPSVEKALEACLLLLPELLAGLSDDVNDYLYPADIPPSSEKQDE